MSRTIRRPQSHGGYYKKEFEGRNTHWENLGYGTHWYAESWEEWLRDVHKDGTWTMSTPSSWNKAYHTKPRRAKTRMAIQKVYKLIDYEDEVNFPLDKKPHIYYW